jgi:hypothetical protein
MAEQLLGSGGAASLEEAVRCRCWRTITVCSDDVVISIIAVLF